MNDPVEMWVNRMKSKFDVPEDMLNNLEVEEEEEEVSRECEICGNIFVVRKEYKFANEDEFICPYCVFILANMKGDK